ncbi:AAA family ATPase [Salmonella enterica]|uniref:ParA family protein n=28 Tax=Salmonella enterica TaxID=28901 RepID=A0A719FZG7_SALTS|nr:MULTISPECIES: AAA family ATPase [Bacteria]EAB5867255.1 ParA family protein [Salmonella enterica subsp. enterica serovar Cairina]EAC0770373.1 ParA family protein [Salmonella enterica subsp. enterica serovar Typhimurium str. UK-1]EBB4919305.1 ParA family protein [Salmonella enterica subsp. enterica serovar Enteritidis]EBC4994786.1 ParA family protein [Salmonella enterica subsp. enterica serovar Infantis]EBC9763791.1 ParA family protein [Salmonella enterica subsp. enterica serovar Tennessee]E
MPASVISFINMKGGVGKTTLCVGIAEFMANYLGKRVLVIDVDPQFNATQSLLGHYGRVDEYLDQLQTNKITIRRIFEVPTSIMDTAQAIRPVDVITKVSDNLDVILGDINIIFDTSQESVRIFKIKRFIDDNNLRDQYDYIFLDSPPTISIFTDASLVASDFYVVPVKIDHYSILGATSLVSVVRNVRHNHNPNIRHLGFVYTNTDDELTLKTSKIKDNFEEKFSEFYFFEHKLSYVRDLMVGQQGNIPSCYTKSRSDISAISTEFALRVDQLMVSENG